MSCPNNEATKLESKKDHECKENLVRKENQIKEKRKKH